MESNIVFNAVRRSNRLMLIAAVIGIIAIASVTYVARNQIVSFFTGPRELATQELVQVKDAEQIERPWVMVKGSSIIDTGWQNYTTHDNGPKTIDSSYAALSVGKRFLLVEIPGEIDEKTLPETFTGELQNIPSDVEDQVIADIRQQSPSAAKAFLPLLLDTADFRREMIFPGGIFFVTGILVTLALIYMWVRRTINPLRHPFLKALARYGDPKQLSETISYEMSNAHTQVGKNIHITPHWLVFNRGGGFQMARLQDVAWAYQKIIQRRTYGINTGKTFQAEVWDQQGKLITFVGKQDEVLAGLQAIAQAASWVVIGYSAEIDQKWRKNRAEFVAMVKQRRDQ
ncbi:MAG: DUF6709 family protein [Chloroflexota bacterium]